MSSIKKIMENVVLSVDNTYSMGQACAATRGAFPEIRTQLTLQGAEVNTTVIGDFDSSTPNSGEGGWMVLPSNASHDEVTRFMNTYVKNMGGGGLPEAYKTAFNHIINMKPSLAFMLCDAVPHGTTTLDLDNEGQKEEKYLNDRGMITDWDTLCATVKSLGIEVVIFLTTSTQKIIDVWSKMGTVICMNVNSSTAITKAMMWTFNALTNQPQMDQNPCEFKSITPVNPIFEFDMKTTLADADPEQVISSFEFLLDAKTPESVLCLTTNDVIGKFWRLICGKYKFMDERKYEARCQGLMNALSTCMQKLSVENKAKLKEWIDRSHNATAPIREMVGKNLPNATSFLVLPEPLRKTLDLDGVLELGRGGGFSEVARLISSLQQMTGDDRKFSLPEDEEKSPDFIPLHGPAGNIFSLIGNLLSSGYMFSRVEGFMVAIMALNNEHLAEMALAYLTEHKGRWIKWDLSEGKQLFPVFWSLNFMRLLKLAPDSVLTDAEIKFRNHYVRVSQIVGNHRTTVEIITPLMFTGLRTSHTWKRGCTNCLQDRCFTISPGDSSVCPLCIPDAHTEDPSATYYADPTKIRDKDEAKSNWAQCSSCTGNYTVICPERLNVRPKCHDCRHHLAPQLIECCACLNKYVNPSGSAQIAMASAYDDLMESKGDAKSASRAELIRDVTARGAFICPRCVYTPNEATTRVELPISELIGENPTLIDIIPVSDYRTLMSNTSLWKRVIECKQRDEKEMAVPADIQRLTHKGFTITAPSEVAEQIVTTLLNHSGFETCQMCVSDVPTRLMTSACGNCPNRVCESCVQGWYSQAEIGHLVSRGHCLCPFCKKAPMFHTVRNVDLCRVRNLRPTKQNKGKTCDWEHHSVYGFCTDCHNLKVAMARECAQGELPDIKNFVCDDCRTHRETARTGSLLDEAKSVTELDLKSCPNCQISTERHGGCHHMTCLCGAHWCWVCNSASSEDGTIFDDHTIYDHMADCGGIFPPHLRE